MKLFLHSMILGYGTATLGALGLSETGLPLWGGLLVAWLGGNVLGLGFALAGAALWPEKPVWRSASFTATEEEFRVWDEDLTCEQADADLRRDDAAAGPRVGLEQRGFRTAV